MKERAFDPHRLDVSHWARDGRSLQGQWPLAQCRRLSESLAASADAAVDWTADVVEALPTQRWAQAAMQLRAHVQVPLVCQRCLQPMQQLLEVDRRFLFVASEDEAARLDDDSDEDVLVLSRAFDLLELVEDELILALPIVPRHQGCAPPLLASVGTPAEDDAATADEHPFAALAALKRR